jgi:hypothetical protein
VVALEGVWERARFIALRKEQDKLDRLQVVNSNVMTAELGEAQFDLIIVNGVLEWTALYRDGDPRDVYKDVLIRLRRLLRPGGRIYLGIENRFSYRQFLGEPDHHSELRFTGLVPRPIADWMCRHARSHFRSELNRRGYRTHTYGYRGYRQLFARAGLAIHSAFYCRYGYNCPIEMIPMEAPALRFSASMHTRPPRAIQQKARALAKRLVAQPRLCKLLGEEFVFLLGATDGASASQAQGYRARYPLTNQRAVIATFLPAASAPMLEIKG